LDLKFRNTVAAEIPLRQFSKGSRMNRTNAFIFAVVIAAMLPGAPASAQSPNVLPAQNFYFDDSEWPLPDDNRTSALRLTGMRSVHAVWMSFTRYAGGKPMMDSPVITLLEGSTVKWNAPGGCTYELQLVNANPPLINMSKRQICMLDSGAKAIFRILAAP
jgi:hypothetical protein